MTEQKFEQWAIVEIFGHVRIAGHVTEQAIGGETFIRIDVPESDNAQGMTKLYGKGAIYGMTIVDEETARAAAKQFFPKPVDEWSARRMLGMPDAHVNEYGDEDREDDSSFD